MKREFLKTLREKLSILEDDEIYDIINEYENHIGEKVKEGKTEKEAIKDFGNIDELANEILGAYKVKGTYKKESKTEFVFNTIVDEMVNFFKKIGELFQNKSGEDLIRLICKFVLIVVVVCLLQIPFSIINHLIGSIINFTFSGNILSNVIGGLWSAIIQIVYFITSIYIIYISIKKLILEGEVMEKEPEVKTKSKNSKTKVKESNIEYKESDKVVYKDDIKKDSKVVYKESTPTSTNIFIELIMIVIKVIAVIMLIPVVLTLIAFTICFGFMVAFATQGVYLVSLFFIIIGLIIMTSSVIGFTTSLIFKKEVK